MNAHDLHLDSNLIFISDVHLSNITDIHLISVIDWDVFSDIAEMRLLKKSCSDMHHISMTAVPCDLHDAHENVAVRTQKLVARWVASWVWNVFENQHETPVRTDVLGQDGHRVKISQSIARFTENDVDIRKWERIDHRFDRNRVHIEALHHWPSQIFPSLFAKLFVRLLNQWHCFGLKNVVWHGWQSANVNRHIGTLIHLDCLTRPIAVSKRPWSNALQCHCIALREVVNPHDAYFWIHDRSRMHRICNKIFPAIVMIHTLNLSRAHSCSCATSSGSNDRGVNPRFMQPRSCNPDRDNPLCRMTRDR